MFKKILALTLLAAVVVCQLQVPLHHHINNMLTGEVGVGHLIQFNLIYGQHFAVNIDISQLNPHCDWVSQIGHIGWNINPYGRFRSLHFGSNSRVQTLNFVNHINSAGHGLIVSNAILGIRSGSSLQLISAYGVARIQPIQQYDVQVHRKCKRILFVNKCHNENVHIPRGYHHHELNAIIQETERRAVIAMRQSLGHGQPIPEPSLQLASPFVHEHNQLRTLYPEIEYHYNDFADVNEASWNDVLWHAMDGRGDQGIRDRIFQYLVSHAHTNFIFAASHQHLYYLIVHKNGNGTFNLHVSLFIVGGGGRLPNGAFAASLGAWSLERGGEGATPSIWQILGIFGYK